MNYYERHIGDYIKDTVILSMMEDGAYNRLMDQYYQSECPLPLDRKEIYKLARAVKATEKKAVDYVLGKYFEETEHGYIQKRIQEEIEKFWEKDAGNSVKKDNDKERQQRSRERRKALFDALREHNVVPKYNTPTSELQDMLSRVTGRDKSGAVASPVTGDDTANQSPDPNPQYPIDQSLRNGKDEGNVTGAVTDQAKARVVHIAVTLRTMGVRPMTTMHPQAIEWASNPAVTDEILKAAIQQARDYKPSGDISPNYLKPIVEQLLNPPPGKSGKQVDAWWESNAGIDRKGRELGMQARGTESYGDFKQRIFAEIRKREGKQ